MTKLTNAHDYQLFIALPMAFDEDSFAIYWCIARCGYQEATEENFQEVYNAVRDMMQQEFPKAPPRSW